MLIIFFLNKSLQTSWENEMIFWGFNNLQCIKTSISAPNRRAWERNETDRLCWQIISFPTCQSI